ncbi:hypothetical protein [Marinobacter alexandrii]|uniref:hypothetical protein n=1 Tax=Marinobacter alexandrii TaxID=2570351 RepID=UPI0011085BA1|nr:hypothetical protein [Marinobacter alexandrii]
MKLPARISLQGTCLTLALGLGALGAGSVQAESIVDDVQVRGAFDSATIEHKGTVDLIPADGRGIIVDDTLLELDSVITVNGQNWSREHLARKLEQGMQITYELKQGLSGPQPVIVSIKVHW